jgi:hypothetical protein
LPIRRAAISADELSQGVDLRGVAPVAEVFAPLLVVGDVVRVDDPQAHGVVRVLVVAGECVTLELRPAGLASPADAAVRGKLPWNAGVERLGTVNE